MIIRGATIKVSAAKYRRGGTYFAYSKWRKGHGLKAQNVLFGYYGNTPDEAREKARSALLQYMREMR